MDPTDRLEAESHRLLGFIASLEARIHALERIAVTTGEAVAAAAALLDTLTDAVKRHVEYERVMAGMPTHRATLAGVDENGYPHFGLTPLPLCDCVHCRKQRADETLRRLRRDADV